MDLFDGFFNILLLTLKFTGEVAVFGLKALIIVMAFLLCVIIIKKLNPPQIDKKKLKVENIKSQYEKYIQQFKQKTMSKKEFKKYLKESMKGSDTKKEKNKFSIKSLLSKSPHPKKNPLETKKPPETKNQSKASLFVLSFEGDIMASQVKNLREEVSILLNIAQAQDEVVLVLDSRGGSVSHYGLAANQLQRLRNNNIPLTVCVDKIAGSGGYLMACVAHQILASPFAFIGSIGVLFGIPNVHDLLKKHDISYEEFTAGKYKRTVTPLGKITDEKRQRLQEQLNLIHDQFKNFVKQYRNIDLDQVATGEAWLAETALKKGLVDKLQCSDDYILEKIKSHNVYKVSLRSPQTFLEKLMSKKPASVKILDNLFQKNEII